MLRLVVPSFLVLGFAFYQLSGGRDFEPPVVEEIVQKQAVISMDVMPIDVTPADARVTEIAAQAKRDLFGAVPESEAIPARMVLSEKPTLWSASTQDAQGDVKIATLTNPDSFALTAETVALSMQADSADIRYVNGSRVNMRNGPGTHHNVLDKLTRDTQVELLNESVGSWVKLRVVETNRVGWMSASLLRE